MKTEIITFVSFARRSLLASALLGAVAVQGQTSYTFTNANATGNAGPTQGMVSSAYASTNLNGQVTVVTQGIQEWVVPITGAYGILALGGQGYGTNGVGGRGAKMYGEFNLTAGQILKVLVGQQGELPSNVSYNAQFGGGGGSFVTDASNNPMVVAGGGGGNWSAGFSAISDAPVGTAGNNSGGAGSTASSGGVNGAGGGSANSADGGGGFNTDGTGTAGGDAFLNGGLGGFTTSGIGGFGGGGGTSSFNNRRGGGGGGYSGGGGAEGVTTGFPEGGGGGSYNAGINQDNASGFNTGMGSVVITRLCNVAVTAASNPICLGSAVTLSTNAVTTTSWSPIGPSGSPTLAVSPSVTTSYSVTGTGSTGCVGTAVIVVTVMPLPQVYAAGVPSVLCAGKTGTLFAYGANSYSWGPNVTGNMITVSPSVNTVYTFTGTNTMGCKNTGSISVVVNNLSISAQAGAAICAGSGATLTAAGANTYTWSTGTPFQSITVYPTTSTIYSVAGTDVGGCVGNTTVMVNVNPAPVVSASADRNMICRGETVTLTATGASGYLWSNGATGSVIAVALPIDIVYNFGVTGTGANGCESQAGVVVVVNRCTAIEEQGSSSVFLSAYPNPATSTIRVDFVAAGTKTAELVDVSGRVLQRYSFDGTQEVIDLSGFSAGIYYLHVVAGTSIQDLKIVKQ